MNPDSHLLHTSFVVVYLLALIGVGAIKARKVNSQADFSLAGRGLSTFVLVGTLLATWIGTGSIFGNAEETYRVGVPAFLLPVSGALGIIALYFLAARVRRIGQFTIQDILEERYGVAVRVIGTVTLLLSYVIIVSYQYRAGSAVLERLMPGMGNAWAVVAVALFVILYTALAGMFSVAYTDVANGILMAIGIAIALPILVVKAGGTGALVAALEPGGQHLFGHYSAASLISVLLPSFLLLLGDANMYQRFFSARDPAAARRSAAWMFAGVVLLECAIIATALAGASLVAQGKVAAPENQAHIVVHLAFDVLPAFLGAMLVATVVAVVVSTADSYLLAPSTALVRDVYQRFLRPDAPENRVVLVGRVIVVLLGLIALGLAFTSDRFFHVALFAYTVYGAGITPALIAAFFWKRATPAGALSSMLVGVGTSIVWKFLIANESVAIWATDRGIDGLASVVRWAVERNLDAVIPATLVNVTVLITVSLMSRPASGR
ncbi:MAG: sodium:solute symporter, partial [Planctomycetota bacterium]